MSIQPACQPAQQKIYSRVKVLYKLLLFSKFHCMIFYELPMTKSFDISSTALFKLITSNTSFHIYGHLVKVYLIGDKSSHSENFAEVNNFSLT